MKRRCWLLLALVVSTFPIQVQAQPAAAPGAPALTVAGAGRETFCVAFSPDNRWLAAGGQGLTTGEVKIFSFPSGEETLQIKYPAAPHAIAFSPNGKLLAAAIPESRGAKLHVWDLATGKEIYVLDSLSGHQAWSFSPDGEKIATGNTDSTVTVWNAASGDEVSSFAPEELRNPIGLLRHHPTGKYLIGAENGGAVVRVWQASDGAELKRLDMGGSILDLEVSKGGRQVAVRGSGITGRLVNLSDGRLAVDLNWRLDASSNLAYSPSGQLLAVRGLPANRDNSGPIKVWDAGTGRELFQIKGKSPTSLQFSPDSSLLAGTLGREGVMVWKVGPVDKTFRPVETRVLAESADPTPAPTGSEPATSAPKTASIVTKAMVLRGHQAPQEDESPRGDHAITGLALSPDNTRLASANGWGEVMLWDLKTGESTMLASEGAARFVSFTTDGKTLLGGDGSQVSAWDVETGAGIASFGDGSTQVSHRWYVAPDGSVVATLDYPGDGVHRYRFYRVPNPEPIFTLDLTDTLDAMALAKGGGMAAIVDDADVRLFDLETKKEIEPILGLPFQPSQITFDPSGKTLMVGESGGDFQFWNVAQRPAELISRHEGDLGGSGSSFLSSDGALLVLAYNEVRLWSMASSRMSEPILGLTAPAALSDDARTIVGMTDEDTTLVADIVSGSIRTILEVGLPPGKSVSQYGPSGVYAVSRDGSFAAIGTKSGVIEVRPLTADATSGEEVVVHLKPPEAANRDSGYGRFPGMAFSEDGSYLFYRRQEWTAAVELASGKVWFPAKLDAAPPVPLRMSHYYVKPEQKTLFALAASQKSLWKYDMTSGRATQNRADRREYYALQMAPDGKSVACILKPASKPAQLVLMSPDDGKVIGEPLIPDLSGTSRSLELTPIAFSSNSRRLAAALDRKVRVWDLESRRELTLNADGVWNELFLVEGGAVLGAIDNSSDLRELKLWNVDTAQSKGAVDVARGHTGRVTAVDVSPTDRLFASVGENGEVLLRDLESGDIRARLAGHVETVDAVAFSPDGKRLATAAAGQNSGVAPKERTIRIWNVDTASLSSPELAVDKTASDSVADGSTSETSGGEKQGPMRLQAPREVASFEVEMKGKRALLQFSPSGAALAVGLGDSARPLLYFDIAGKKQRWSSEESCRLDDYGLGGPPFRFSKDGRTLLADDGTRGFLSVDTATGKATSSDEKWNLRSVAISPDGATIAFGVWSEAGENVASPAVLLLDASTLKERGPKLELRGGTAHALTYSPDGSLLAASVGEKTKTRILLLDPQTLEVRETVAELGANEYAAGIGFSPQGDALWYQIQGGSKNHCPIWSITEKKLKRSGDSAAVTGQKPVGFVGSSALMAFRRDRAYTIYEVATDKTRHTLDPARAHQVAQNWNAFAMSKDGKVMVSGDVSGKVVVWDVLRGKPMPAAGVHEEEILAIALSDDGRLMATAGAENKVKVWTLDGSASAPVDAEVKPRISAGAAGAAPKPKEKPANKAAGPLVGDWSNPGDWGNIVLKGGPESYTGTYSGTYNGELGTLRLKKSGNGFDGEWSESDKSRRGTLKLKLSQDGKTLLVDWRASDGDQGKSSWKRK